jgi:hypothetical protein
LTWINDKTETREIRMEAMSEIDRGAHGADVAAAYWLVCSEQRDRTTTAKALAVYAMRTGESKM